ncbi:hypothetical protein Tco_1160361 [Tanacetum coccineum]
MAAAAQRHQELQSMEALSGNTKPDSSEISPKDSSADTCLSLSIPSDWDAILTGGLRRMKERKIVHNAGIYGFWKHVSKLNMLEIRRLLPMFYALNYQKSAESIPLVVNEQNIGNGNGDMHHKAVVLHLRAARKHREQERGVGRGWDVGLENVLAEPLRKLKLEWKQSGKETPTGTSTTCIIEGDHDNESFNRSLARIARENQTNPWAGRSTSLHLQLVVM